MANKKRIIVIGASSGIGRAIALEFAKKGYMVGIAARRKPLLEEIAKKYEDRIIAKNFDITDLKELDYNISSLINDLGGVDIFIFSAGIGKYNPEREFKKEQEVFNLNILAFTKSMNYLYNFFKQKGSGHLVAITSVAGLLSSWENPSYRASKAFQINYLTSLRLQSRIENKEVIVTDIRPGYVKTEMIQENNKTFWVSDTEKAAFQIFVGIKKRKRIIYVSKRWGLIAFFFKTFPRWISLRI